MNKLLKKVYLSAMAVIICAGTSIAGEEVLTCIMPSQDVVRGKKGAVGSSYKGLTDVQIGENYLLVEGNVGIGTTSPAQKLHVVGSDNSMAMCIGSPLDNGLDWTGMFIGDYSVAKKGGIIFQRTASWNRGSLHFLTDNTADVSDVNISEDERMTITSAGNVGIGTTNPGSILEIAKSDTKHEFRIGDGGVDGAADSHTRIEFSNSAASTLLKMGQVANYYGQLAWLYNATPANAYFSIDTGLTGTPLVLKESGGNVGIGTTDPHFGLDVRGAMGFIGSGDNSQSTGGWRLGKQTTGGAADIWVYLRTADGTVYQDLAVGALYAGGATQHGTAVDIAEMTPVREKDNLESGDVVCIDKTQSVRLTKSVKSYDTNVAGIISTKAALTIGGADPVKDKERKDLKPIALAGRAPCKVTTENGSIEIGDLLVTSSKPGYAMKADIDKLKPGMVLGKAMEPLKKGEGKIIVWLQK